MSGREQSIAGESIKVIRDISIDLPVLLPLFHRYKCVVILSKENTGKSSSAARIIMNTNSDCEYITFTEQDKGTLDYPEPTLKTSHIPINRLIIIDELHSDNSTDDKLREHVKSLLKTNRLVILSNLYGSGKDPLHEISLFKKHEADILPENTLFVLVTNS